MLLRTITCLFPSIPNLFLCMPHSRYVNARNFKPIEFIGWQQATLNFKDTLEDSCWSQQDCSLKYSANSIPELFMFFQLNLQVFRIVPSAPKQKGQVLHLHLPQVVSSCQMKILSLVDYTLLFDVHPFVTRTCNISDEAIFVLLVHTHDVKAIVIQFHFCLYTEIRKKFEIIIVVVDDVMISMGSKEVSYSCTKINYLNYYFEH